MIEEQKFYWTLLDTLKDGVYFADKKRKITYWNKAAEVITGYRCGEILGKFCGDNLLIHIDEAGNTLCTGVCPLARTMETGETYEEKIYLHHKDGHRVPVSVRTTPVYGSQEEIVGAVEIFTDLSAREPLAGIPALGKPGLLGSLTGLPTRQYLEMSIKMKFFEWKEFRHLFGIFCIKITGLEGFARIHGREKADEVIQTFSRTLIHNMAPCEMVGEWSDGEFMGIAAYTDEEKLTADAARCRLLLEKTELSHILGTGTVVSPVFSVGAALVQEGDTPGKLVERARKI